MIQKIKSTGSKALFHLPGLFEFYDLYKIFIPLFYEHNEWFYPWCAIGSLYGAPSDSLWAGGRTGFGNNHIEKEVLALITDYNISARLTFSNSKIENIHLQDKKCNHLCNLFHNKNNGIIIYSDLLLDYIRKKYPDYYFVSSTTKVLTLPEDFYKEVKRKEFRFVVPDFRFNNKFHILEKIPCEERTKVEFLCNECCWTGCTERKACYENVSLKAIGENCQEHKCCAPDSHEGYVFSKAMKKNEFIGLNEIQNKYIPAGFTNFKIEGRSLGSALILEFLLYYMTKPEYHINVREKIYLDNSLDLF